MSPRLPRYLPLASALSALTACGVGEPDTPADPQTLATLLSSAFGYVPGRVSPAHLLANGLADAQRLCGPKGKDVGTQRVTFQEVRVLEREGVYLYTVEAKGRCSIDGTTGYRPVSGRFRIEASAGFVETERKRRGPSRGYFVWSLKGYTMIEPGAPGAWVEVQPQPPAPHCPESVAKAASQYSTCNPRNPTVCWFGEMGCKCSMMGLPWKCGMGGCPAPRPEPGATCSDPLVRCLPEGDAGGRTLTCESGRWTESTVNP